MISKKWAADVITWSATWCLRLLMLSPCINLKSLFGCKKQKSELFFLIFFEVGVPLVIISKLRDPVTFALEVNIFDIYILMILIYFFYNFWAFLSLPVCLLCLEGRDDQQLAGSLRAASLSESVYSFKKNVILTVEFLLPKK